MRLQKHKKESFNARIQMEKNEQKSIAARLTLMEMKYLNKTRTHR